MLEPMGALRNLEQSVAGRAVDCLEPLLQDRFCKGWRSGGRQMARKVRWRHLITQAAIMSMVLHAIIAALMLPAPSAMADGGGVYPETSVICSASPFKPIGSGENGNQAGKQLPKKSCLICDGIATSGFLLETAQAALIGRLTNPTVLRPSEELRPASIACLAHNNRGPPLPA